MGAVSIGVGILGVVWILYDIFTQVLVPRAVEGRLRISVLFARFARTLGIGLLRSFPSVKTRENLLGMFAPTYFVTLLALWLTGLALSYALILFSLRYGIRPMPESFGAALYIAATTVIPIGSGSFAAIDWPVRIVMVLAGASGIGTFAVTIAFLYAIIGSFQERERFVVVLDARAGAPPSGLALLETYATLGMLDDLPGLFRESGKWAAQVLDSHLAYPILISFRSSHKDESWVAALGALLDAAALLVTVVEGLPAGEARLFLDLGMHLTHDLAAFFDLPQAKCPRPTAAELATLSARLRAAGLRLRDGPETWKEFARLRETYAAPLQGVAQRWFHAPAALVGERTTLPGHDE